MQSRNIDSELQTKVFQYIEMLRVKKKKEPDSGQGILEIMNPKLRENISKLGKYFQRNFHIQCKEQVFGPGETIYYQQEHDLEFSEDGEIKYNQQSQCIFLIIKGKVSLTQDNRLQKMNKKQQNKMKTVYQDGESFGVKEFFCGIPYEFTAQSKGLTTVMKIQRSHILDALKRFPKDYEVFSMMKDDLTFNQPDRFLKCQPCQRYDHSLYKCPQMHYLKRKQKAIFCHISSEMQERNQIHNRRDKRKKFNSLGNDRFEIKQQLKLIRVNLIIKLKKQAIIEEKEKQKQELTKTEQTINMINLFSQENSDSDIELSQSLGIARHQFNESFNIQQSMVKRQQTKFLTKDETELIENSQEGQDELFYFKCPMISWDDQRNTYILSSEIDEMEGNYAIQQYIEQNFYLFFNQGDLQQINMEQNNLVFKLLNDLNDNIPSNLQNIMANNSGLNNQANYQGDTSLTSLDNISLQTPQLIPKRSPRLTTISKHQALPDIVEEDVLIQMSNTSLSFDEQDENFQKQHRISFDIKHFQKFNKNTNDTYQNQQFGLQNQNILKEDLTTKNMLLYPNTQIINDTFKLQNDIPNQIHNGIQTNNILNQVGEILEAQNNPQNIENQQESQKRNSRTSKHFHTFKQLKTLLSLSLDVQNKQGTPKNRQNQHEVDSFTSEEQKNYTKSPTRISNFGALENDLIFKKRNKEINNEQDNNNNITFFNENTQNIRRPSSRRQTDQPSFSSELRTGNFLSERQKSNRLENSQQAPQNQQKQTQSNQLQQLNQSLQISGLNGYDPNTIKLNNPNFVQIPKNEYHGFHIVDQSNQIGEMLSFIFSFDKACNFQKYFPKGNLIHVMNKYIKYQDQFTFKYMNTQFFNQRTGKNNPRTPKTKKQKSTKKEASQFSKKV